MAPSSQAKKGQNMMKKKKNILCERASERASYGQDRNQAERTSSRCRFWKVYEKKNGTWLIIIDCYDRSGGGGGERGCVQIRKCCEKDQMLHHVPDIYHF